jgi:hypothetical protein
MRILLSYSQLNGDIARYISEALEDSGAEVIDVGGIFGGENWKQETIAAVSQADWFVALISQEYLASPSNEWQIQTALSGNRPILPVLLDDTELPQWIKRFTQVDIREALIAYDQSQLWTKALPIYEATGRIFDFIKSADKTDNRAKTIFSGNEIKPKPQLAKTKSPDRIFVAYSRKQRQLAEGLYNLLIKNGKAVFWDAKIKAGATWRQTIQKALDDATHLIVVWTPDAANSDEVEREVSYALAERKVIVPILSKEIPKLPYHLHGLHYIILEEDLSTIENDLLKAIAQFSEDEDIWQ